MNFGSKIVFVVALVCYFILMAGLIGFGVSYAYKPYDLTSAELVAINAHRLKNKTERPYVRLGEGIILDPATTIIYQAFDKRYGDKIGYLSSRKNQFWAKQNGYAYKLFVPETKEDEMPHFLRYRVFLELARDPRNKNIVYIDGDAVVNKHHKYLMSNDTDVTFGNEVSGKFGKLYHNAKHKYYVFNTGYMCFKNNDFTIELAREILTGKKCKDCRKHGCGIWNFKDQGCLDKLIEQKSRKYLDDHFSILNVQSRNKNTKKLVIHAAGIHNNEIRRKMLG